ncbi:hypothetical protein CCR94_19230 [Rhodoblastus sphagnicola]|uniref:GvpL/GvpF family gas vesicle protein n=1 Tax=Rhodoblastus sphagnicola TaxID=333368 RepID=A0A2S6MZL6_9HYPH|nr:GvpL/GvpF family gas vesicle protein [Rhodoblastus sphagnicola]MBB4200725.1 hypothetical protein [Rhodoblastus sphagnicola]PPQ27799.1 hypothetical protein CCR94_19230 [Rhodoblastus sphagnicola]
MSRLRLIGVARRCADEGEAGRLACGTFTAWVARDEEGSSRDEEGPNLDAVKRHHRLVLGALAEGAFLPAPFGRIYESEAEVRQDLLQRDSRLAPALDRAETHEEWSLRCKPQAAAMQPASTGRAYLLGRQQAKRDIAEALTQANAFRAALTESGGVTDCLALHRDGGELMFSLLVRRDARRHSLDAAEAAAFRLFPGFTTRFSGPWPLYSFSGLKADRDETPEARP